MYEDPITQKSYHFILPFATSLYIFCVFDRVLMTKFVVLYSLKHPNFEMKK